MILSSSRRNAKVVCKSLSKKHQDDLIGNMLQKSEGMDVCIKSHSNLFKECYIDAMIKFDTVLNPKSGKVGNKEFAKQAFSCQKVYQDFVKGIYYQAFSDVLMSKKGPNAIDFSRILKSKLKQKNVL